MSSDVPPGETRVCAIGLWHLGSVVSACLAHLGYRVAGFDPDAGRVERLERGLPPLFEPGLEELVRSGLSERRLSFHAGLAEAVAGARFVLLTVDTPVDEKDEADVSGILELAARVSPLLEDGAAVIVMSQVPVGTCRRIEERLRRGRRLHLACCPENLKLGEAIERFLRPPMIVLGADDDAALDAADRLFEAIAAPRLRTGLETAEMVKHALNAFSATCISYANELARLCEGSGADALAVAAAMRHDERVGAGTPLLPGLGFAGGTLARDVNALRALAARRGGRAPLLDAVVAVNREQREVIAEKLRAACGPLDGLTLSVFGLTYKPGTSTLRRSLSIDLIAGLAGRGSRVRAFDPRADLGELPPGFPADVLGDPYEAARDSDALLICTAWPEFRALDFDAIRRVMRRPVVIDSLNLLDRDRLLAQGFTYVGMGR